MAALITVAMGCTGGIRGFTGDADTGMDPDQEPSNDSSPQGTVGPDDVHMIAHELEESFEDFVNPERGYYGGVNLLDPGDMGRFRAQGHGLVIAVVRLDDYRDRALDPAFLDDLQAGFAATATAGVKLILRFSYNASFTDDAPLSRVLQHIEQLAPYLQANADVIAVMQAGFIGAWGEWHGSTNGLDSDSARAAILDALLTALPTDRAVQVRTPMFKDAAFGGPLDNNEAFTGAARARIGHHNDCFLASDDDLGTYAAPIDAWLDYVARDTQYVPMGGETCLLYPPRTDCSAALAALEDHHWSYLNAEYQTAVLDSWASQGCGGEVARRLGYRLVATRVAHAATVRAGDALAVSIDLVNRGFAAPFNPRPVYLVLRSDSVRVARLLDVDPRRWLASSAHRVTAAVPLPDDLPEGTYSLALSLPDAAPGLATDPRFAVRLANPDVWDDATGDNVLVEDAVVVTRN